MKKMAIVAVAGTMALTGCATDPMTGQQTMNRGAVGALLGAAAGAAVDKNKRQRGALIGAAVGGGVGLYMENQQRRLREQLQGTGVSVEQNQQTGAIDLVMPGNITFATNSDVIAPAFQGTLGQLAQTLSQYDRTSIMVRGYTDNTGSVSYNQNLSQMRANSVANYLIRSGVNPARIQAVGYGMSNPVASNSTEAGRAQNRRVELTINPPANV